MQPFLSKHRFTLVLSSLLLLIAGVAAAAFAATDTNPGSKGIRDPIRIDSGLISGAMTNDIGMRTYWGIPYATPPVGKLRWMPPQAVVPWQGVKELTQYGPSAPQPWPPLGGAPYKGATASEDCLYLNVNTPAKNTNDRLPVMVWFHGGGLTITSGNGQSYNAPGLPQHGVVTVTVNHRLGPIGYMADPLLSAEQGGASGNYGAMDLIAALKWVQRNIAAFGGDPSRVTIFGESGGGTKVASLLLSPEAKGLFHRAIMESGGATQFQLNGQQTLAQAEARGSSLMQALGATTLAQMRALPWEDIIAKSNKIGFVTAMTVDGRIIPDSGYNIVEAGKQNDVPLMVGGNEWENTLFGPVSNAAAVWSKVKSKSYIYVFAHMPSNWSDLWAPHAFDVNYTFGSFADPIVGVRVLSNYFAMLKHINHTPSADPGWPDGQPSNPDPGLNKSDDYVSNSMMSIWAQFAATGEPAVPGLIKAPPYNAKHPQYLKIADPLTIKDWDSSAFVSTKGELLDKR